MLEISWIDDKEKFEDEVESSPKYYHISVYYPESYDSYSRAQIITKNDRVLIFKSIHGQEVTIPISATQSIHIRKEEGV